MKDILEPTGHIPKKLQFLKTPVRANLYTWGGQFLLQMYSVAGQTLQNTKPVAYF